MRQLIILYSICTCVFASCSQTVEDSITDTTNNQNQEFEPNGQTIEERYNVPDGFERAPVDSVSFAFYLRNLPLKDANAEVTYYNGQKKVQGNVYRSVVDLPIGTKNLHQCADAVMRFRAQYLWSTQQHDKIHFNFTNGFQVDYSKWLAGNRMVVSGNNTYWKQGTPRKNDYASFWKYMELIFNYAGTLSLEKELESRPYQEMEIGDVLIQGGSPGHAVIVVDMCMNPETKEKKYLLAQSYMPAQETQILLNPSTQGSSWYSLDDGATIRTPEWIFYSTNLKHF